MLEVVSSNLQQCESELSQLRAKEPRRLPTQQRVLDVTLLLLTGVWFYRAWQLGGVVGQQGLPGFGTGLLDSLPGFGPTGLLPTEAAGRRYPERELLGVFCPDLTKILSWHPRILVFPNFIPKAKAQHIIDIAKGRMAPSGLAWRRGETPDPDQQKRTSTGVFLSRLDDPDGVLSWLEEKISSVTLLPVNHGEAFNILRYELNQRYESHMDTFDPKDFGPQRSQRMATMLFYLSEVLEGVGMGMAPGAA
eukprot:gene11372-11521_t